MKQRVSTIDGLRGFSLLGILMANMLIFQYGMFGKDQLTDLMYADHLAYIWLKIFVESSFMPIFMFLFGYSMIMMKGKLDRNGSKVKRHFVRRFLLLILFGLLHSFFIWEGDILFSYGLMGLILLVFLNRKKKTLLIWSIGLLIVTSLMAYGDPNEMIEDETQLNAYVEKANHIYSTGSYSKIYTFRNSDEDPFGWPDYMYVVVLLVAPFITAPMFLLGMYAANKEWFATPKQEKKRYVWFASVFIALGLLLKSIRYLIPDSSWGEVAYTLGSSLLALGYIFGFALLYTTEKLRVQSWFEKVGRLSMTNYLMQSIVCTALFYGYGLGWFGKLGVLVGIGVALVLYVLQIITSHYYLKLFKMGPFERVMRVGTYLSFKGKPKRKKKDNDKVVIEEDPLVSNG
ncbi:DUF418 domain-containing protein [Mesobacillus maritimus]|uniref:DUF418 domain-containing protein n=1 Tax=Mesobacillus maritimus TaxID=1643336 RepID=A0ABS7K083_9BACI|nr:DUF418 domain-containing protein [Mesobacillus maritimus]MBY0095658.1 DUF418 domain-containing protein [Mesobacillus maritimus]